MSDLHSEQLRELTQEELNRKPRCFKHKELVDIVTKLEDIQYYIRYAEQIDKSHVEKLIRTVMGELWRYR
jgi:uncharacterized protein (DUF2461 family)